MKGPGTWTKGEGGGEGGDSRLERERRGEERKMDGVTKWDEGKQI